MVLGKLKASYKILKNTMQNGTCDGFGGLYNFFLKRWEVRDVSIKHATLQISP